MIRSSKQTGTGRRRFIQPRPQGLDCSIGSSIRTGARGAQAGLSRRAGAELLCLQQASEPAAFVKVMRACKAHLRSAPRRGSVRAVACKNVDPGKTADRRGRRRTHEACIGGISVTRRELRRFSARDLAVRESRSTGPLAGEPGARPFQVEAGATLFRQGDPSDGLYMIKHGEIDILRRVPGDETVRLAVLGRSAIVGEMNSARS